MRYGIAVVMAMAGGMWMAGCCPTNTDDPPKVRGVETASTTGGATPPAETAAQGECTGDNADSELPCKLPDKRWGWCKKGRCKDVCPAGFSYSHLDTACHKPCTAGCKNCMDEACLDDATTRPMLEN